MEPSSDDIKSLSGDTCKRYCNLIERLEPEYQKTDRLVEDTIETVNIDIGSESETDTISESGSINWEFDISDNAYFNE